MRVRGLRTDGRTDFGSCDDFHFSGLIESVSRAIAALIEWAYLTDLSAGAELTYLPFTACREICSRRCRSEGKESPKKNGMDAPIEFAAAPLLKEAREDRRQISIGGSGARKTCFAIHANGLGMPPSLDNQADALNTKPPVQTDARFAFSHRHLVFVSDVGLAAGWGVALNLSRHEREDGRTTHPAHACYIVILIIAVPQLVFDQDDTRPTRPSPPHRSVRVRSAPHSHYAKSSMRRPPPSPFGRPRDRVDGRGSHDGCGHLSLPLSPGWAGSRRTRTEGLTSSSPRAREWRTCGR